MALELRPNLKQVMGLVMTQQMQQALKLLQLGRLELIDQINQEMMENPLLDLVSPESSESEAAADSSPEAELIETASASAEADQFAEAAGESETSIREDFDWENYLGEYSSAPAGPSMHEAPEDTPTFESFTAKAVTLLEHLSWQWRLSRHSKAEALIGQAIICNIDDDGYLKTELEGIALQMNTDLETVTRVLSLVQELDPPGVGARDLAECLLLQLKALGAEDSLSATICRNHLKLLEKKDLPGLSKALDCSREEVQMALEVLKRLDPRPGRAFSSDPPQYVSPDVHIFKVGHDYVISLNDDGLPKLRLSREYKELIKTSRGEAKNYLNEKLKGATAFIRYINQRQRTIYRVTESIFRFQRDFLEKGVEHLKPLVLKDVADDVGLHESTISRVTTNKYVDTPRGTYELKYFFDSPVNRFQGESLSSESVKLRIKKIIGAEDPQNPLSDQRIVDILKGANINIARRTVAKYREMLGLGSSSERRRMF